MQIAKIRNLVLKKDFKKRKLKKKNIIKKKRPRPRPRPRVRVLLTPERFLKKLSLMTYASHARVITVIIQTNLIHLSIKMTMPHQSGAPFVGERVFQNRGVCGQAFPSFPSPTPFLSAFCSRPIFRASRRQKKLIRAARISFASYGNACYAGYTNPWYT